MGKIREVFQKMSLKRSLVLLAVFCLSLVSALSVITILTCSSIQKKILDSFRRCIRTIVSSDRGISFHSYNKARIGSFRKRDCLYESMVI